MLLSVTSSVGLFETSARSRRAMVTNRGRVINYSDAKTIRKLMFWQVDVCLKVVGSNPGAGIFFFIKSLFK